MEFLANNFAANLELSIAMPGFSSSPIYFPSSGGSGSAMKELDINKVPSATEEGEYCMAEEEEEDDDDRGSPKSGPTPRKKLRLTKKQSRLLEETFLLNQTLNPKEKESLAVALRLKPRQVEVWFQNRRARSRMKKTEMEYEYLKRCFGTLTEQNRRLKNEVDELRIMKVVPPHCRQPLQATSTLSTMCPRCDQRVSTPTPLTIIKGSATTSSTTTSAAKLLFHQQQRRQTSTTCYD